MTTTEQSLGHSKAHIEEKVAEKREEARQKQEAASEAGRLATEAVSEAWGVVYAKSQELNESLTEGIFIEGLKYEDSNLKRRNGSIPIRGGLYEDNWDHVDEAEAHQLAGETATDIQIIINTLEDQYDPSALPEDLPFQIRFTAKGEEYSCELTAIEGLPIRVNS